jgi:hypothetical protein
MPVKRKTNVRFDCKRVTPRVRYKDYSDYLNSKKWDQVKKDYSENESTEFCLCCGIDLETVEFHFHHFRYSKDWNDDNWENIIIVCGGCHDQLHKRFDNTSNDITLRDYMSGIIITLMDMNRDKSERLEEIRGLINEL